MRVIAIVAQLNSDAEMGHIIASGFPVPRGLFTVLRVEVWSEMR